MDAGPLIERQVYDLRASAAAAWGRVEQTRDQQRSASRPEGVREMRRVRLGGLASVSEVGDLTVRAGLQFIAPKGQLLALSLLKIQQTRNELLRLLA